MRIDQAGQKRHASQIDVGAGRRAHRSPALVSDRDDAFAVDRHPASVDRR
jgi:hypothetical protein